MEKVETIKSQTSGDPKTLIDITWIEFLSETAPTSEKQMYDWAISLLNGDFLFINGRTYFLRGINLRDA